MKLTEKKTDYFGLDVGATGVRMVQLQPGDEAPMLAIHGSRNFEPGADIADVKKLAKLIKEAKDETDIESDNVVVAIPNRYAYTTVLMTPQLTPEGLASHVQERAPEVLPMPLDEVRLDWHVVNPNKGEQMEVLLVAASGEAVDRYVELVKKSGLKLKSLEINALAMARSLISEQSEAVAVIDLGETDTEITAIWRRVPHVVSSVDAGLQALISDVEESFNVDKQQAQDFLHKFGFLESKLEGQVRQAASGSIQRIIEQTQRCMEDFRTINPESDIHKVVLTGNPVSLPGLPAYLADLLNLPVEIANPWMNIVYPAVEHDRLMSESLQFAVAAGLAQKEYI